MAKDELESEQDEELEGAEDLLEEISKQEVAAAPTDVGDAATIIEEMVPEDVRVRYRVYSYRNAATILCKTHKVEFQDLLTALRAFKITIKMIRTAGKNESDIPKLFSKALRPLGWYETVIQGDSTRQADLEGTNPRRYSWKEQRQAGHWEKDPRDQKGEIPRRS